MRKPERTQDAPSTRGGRPVHTPAGPCPVPLTGTAAATVRAWAAAVLSAGHAAGVAYSGKSLRYWTRAFYPPGSPEYRTACEHLDRLFDADGQARPELFSSLAAVAADPTTATAAAATVSDTVDKEAAGDAVAGSIDPTGSQPSAEHAAAVPDLPPHPACALLPPMTDDEYEQLKEDIRVNGLREPIRTCQGQLLDGRHRYRACRELGVEPRPVEWDGPGSPVAFVLSANVHRRHLTTSQRAMIACQAKPLFEAEARQRRRAGKAAADLPLTSEEGGSGEAAAQAARLLRVGRDSVYKAAKVQATGVPELGQAVASGAVSVSAAAVLAGRPAEEQQQALRQGGDAVRKAARAGRQGKQAAPAAADDHGSTGWPRRVDRLAAELVKRYTVEQLRELVERLTARLAGEAAEGGRKRPSSRPAASPRKPAGRSPARSDACRQTARPYPASAET